MDSETMTVEPAVDLSGLAPGLAVLEAPTGEDGSGLSAKRQRVLDAYGNLLYKPDFEALDVAMATVLANMVGGEPVAVFLVAPPSSTKSETVMAFSDLSHTYWVSTLTPNTLASGLDPKDSPSGVETALLDRLNAEGKERATLLLKEFGSVLNMRQDERKELIGQLRDVLDGYYKKAFGTGRVVEWRGTLGMLAGTTPAIETHWAVVASLGDRWLMVRLHNPDNRLQVALEAMDRVGQEDRGRSTLKAAVKDFFAALGCPALDTVACLEDLRRSIADAAAALTLWRTPVERNERGGIDYIPSAEGPARVAKALWKLTKCLALVRGRAGVTEADVATVHRICRDSLPSKRRAILEALAGGLDTVAAIAATARLPDSTARCVLEDLQALNAVSKCRSYEEAKGRPGERWTLPTGGCIFLTEYHHTPLVIHGVR